MNTEYAVGKIRIRFASQARRRWLVVLFCIAVAGLFCAGLLVHANAAAVAWVAGGSGALFIALLVMFAWITGDSRGRRDERETDRIHRAHTLAYRIFGWVLLAALWPVLEFHKHLPDPLIGAGYMFFVTLPGAILLWTEPDLEEERRG